jgi:hypothetical protein
MSEDDFRDQGSSWAERTLTSDGIFVIPVTEPLWIVAQESHLVGNAGIGSSKYYAYALSSDKDLAYREGGAELSGPEVSFEQKAIPSLISNEKTRTRLAFYMKSPENSSRSFKIGVQSLDGKRVSDFYPDYLGEILSAKTGHYLPAIWEVKSEQDVLSAAGKLDSLLTGKAKALADIAIEKGIPAGLVYEDTTGKEPEWKIITHVGADATFQTENFRDYVLGF